ncbi:TM2 domain-containing protein, partial [Yersinia enterocolitica]
WKTSAHSPEENMDWQKCSGIRRSYLGKIGQGFLYLIFCWTFIPSIIAFIEFIIYLCNSDEEFARKYG